MRYEWLPDKDSKIPLYLQLAACVREEIQNGNLKIGDMLPGRRKFMDYFNISRTTVDMAMAQLLNEGLIASSLRKRYTVTCRDKSSTPEWQAYFRRGNYKPGNEMFRDYFRHGALANFGFCSDFDITVYLKHAIPEASSKLKRDNPLPKRGLLSLRESLAKHLERTGIRTEPDNILIAPGTVLAGSALYSALMGYGSVFFHEKPNLIRAITSVHSMGVNMYPISMDKYGLLTSELEQALARSKNPILNTHPADQGPTGITMSARRQKELIKLAKRYQFPIIEMDTARDVWWNKSHPLPPPLKTMDPGGNIIYIGSVFRSFPVDLQLAWIVADSHLIEHLCNVFIQMGVRTNLLLQHITDTMLRNGVYQMMTEEAADYVRQKREYTLELCQKYLSDRAVWVEENCGYNFWLEFPEGDVHQILKNNNLGYVYPGYFFDTGDTKHIHICTPSLTNEELMLAVKSLAK